MEPGRGHTENEGSWWIERLSAPSEEERKKAFQDLVEQRSNLTDRLLATVEQWGENRTSDVVEVDSTEHLALLALGVLRVPETAQTLVEYIEVRDSAFNPNVSDGLIPLDSHFPALRALMQIGKPSVRYLREAIARAQYNLTIQLAVAGIYRIEGEQICRLHLTSLREDIVLGVTYGNEANVDEAFSFVADSGAISELRNQDL
jgi:hypothetical protein